MSAIEPEARARASGGTSADPIYRMVARSISERAGKAGLLLDVGCGTGALHAFVAEYCERYEGMDVVRYEGYPEPLVFHAADLNKLPSALPDAYADLVTAVEVIEHLENPRAFVRELARLAKPHGWVILTTPNQLSLLSKVTLLVKNQFNAFQDPCYPAHITALVEQDLRRIAAEYGLTEIEVAWSNSGRIPFTPWHWPRWLGFGGRAFSDNVLLAGKKTS